MALTDLIATPGEAAAGALAREWKVSDPDVLVRVRDLVDAAVDAEREACAKIAERWPNDPTKMVDAARWNAAGDWDNAVAATCYAICSDIRNRKQ